MIAILFVIFTPRVSNATKKAREAGVMQDFRQYQMAFEQVLKMRTGIVGKSAREWDSYGNSGAERRAADLLKYAAETIDDLNSFLDDGFQIDNINEWQDKKHVGYNNTIRGDSSIAYIECYVLSKLDPWGTKYKKDFSKLNIEY